MPVATYLDAISQALREEMHRDPNVFLMGEDIGAFGGAFKVTDGFIEEFGEERVIDTPISESGFAGAACGLAGAGFAAGALVRGFARAFRSIFPVILSPGSSRSL